MWFGDGELVHLFIITLQGAGIGIHSLTEEFGGKVKINAARTPRTGRAYGARNPNSDVLGMQHTKGSLAVWFGDGELVHLFIITLLQIDDFAFR